MKRITIGVVAYFVATAVWAQDTGPTAPPGTISRTNSAAMNVTNGNTNVTLTNSAGTSFTVDQLSAQLQALRTNVEQTLPMLAAFNERYSSKAGSTLGRAIQDIFSREKGEPERGDRSAAREITNVLSALGALVNTNQSTPSVHPETLRHLVTLQKELEPVAQVLQGLSLGRSTDQVTTTPPSGVPSPAGRGTESN